MNATAGTNPEASAITEVIGRNADQAAQAGEMGLSDGQFSGEVLLPGQIEGLMSGHSVGDHALQTYLIY